jgi:DNA ligase-1
MLCKTTLRENLDDDSWVGYVAEPKHDGTRCLAIRRGDNVRLYSRSGQDYTEHVPHLVDELTELMPRWSILDGELAVLSGHFQVGRKRVPVTNFNTTMRIMGSAAERGRDLQYELKYVSFIVYDLLEWNGEDWTEFTQITRRKMLKSVFPFGSEHLFLNPHFNDPERFRELFDTLIAHGVEGIIVKNESAPYALDGRPNKTWYKVKAATTMDMVVMGYTDGTGKYTGIIGAVEFGRMGPDGELIYVGKCSGMTDSIRREITANKDTCLGRVIEVKSNELVGSKEYRSPRHPQFVCFRTDKLPEDCTGDELKQIAKVTS